MVSGGHSTQNNYSYPLQRGSQLLSSFMTASQNSYLASAGEIGGMIGKKLGLGWSRALPVIRQKEDITKTCLFPVLSSTLALDPLDSSLALDPLPASRPLG